MHRHWFHSPAHDSGRSLNIVRTVVAFILATHAAYALAHPANISGFSHLVSGRGLGFGIGAAWAVIVLQLASSLALVTRRLVVAGCIGHIAVLTMGIVLIHAPKWRTVGLPDGEHQQGAEFSVLLIACLAAILWAHWRKTKDLSEEGQDGPRSRQALELVRLASASILIIHPIGGLRDPAGLNDLGVYFSSLGFPFGVPMVWGAMFLQIGSSLAIIARRLIVPACLGHMLVLLTGIWLFHAPHWFVIGPDNVVGPGHEGVEYSTLLIACFLSVLLAYWPKATSRSDP